MHVEVSRLLTAWLGHDDFGINAIIGTIPRNKFGSGTDKAPQKVTLYNDVETYTDELISVEGINPPKMPAVVTVADFSARTGDVTQEKKQALSYPMVVGIGYYEEGDDRALIIRNSNYVLRAIVRSLWEFNESTARSEAYRQLNGIRIAKLSNITVERAAGAVPASRLLGVVLADLLVMDKGDSSP